MWGCLGPSDFIHRTTRTPALVAALGAVAFAAGCSTRTWQVVDPNPPDPCADGGCFPPGLLDGLVGYWRLDDGTGKTARDSSGRGNDGTLYQLDATAWTAGRAGGGLRIDNTGWVGVVPSPSLDAITNKITVSAWIYYDGSITMADLWGTALSREIGTGVEQHYHLSLYMDGRPSLFITTTSATALLQAGSSVPKTTWVHLAGTYDGTEARLYVDGTLAASQPIGNDFASDNTPLILGGNGNDASGVPTELFPGRLDEIMLYGRALSATEIGQLHAGALFPAGSVDAGTTD
jgi:hypothetical protein